MGKKKPDKAYMVSITGHGGAMIENDSICEKHARWTSLLSWITALREFPGDGSAPREIRGIPQAELRRQCSVRKNKEASNLQGRVPERGAAEKDTLVLNRVLINACV